MTKKGKEFTSENQPDSKGQGKRGKGKRTVMVDALKVHGMNEQQFFEKMVEKALFGGADGGGDPQMMREVAARLYQVPKATLPTFDFEFPSNGSMVERADAIISAIGNSEIPMDVAKIFFDILSDRAKIEEVTEVVERLTRLEELINEQGA